MVCAVNPILFAALYPIINLDSVPDFEAYLDQLHGAGLPYVQLRSKTLSDAEFLRLARTAVSRLRNRVRVIINDRIDICTLSGAAGVHLGQDDLPPYQARRILGPEAVIGYSTHSVSDLTAAASEPVQYFGFGPIFPSATKSGQAPELGSDSLQQALKCASLPVVPIGGITLENVASLFRAGAKTVAVIRDLEQAADRTTQITAYQKIYTELTASAL